MKPSDSWFWTETISATSSASSSWSRLQLERPIQRTLPSSWSSLNAPTSRRRARSGRGGGTGRGRSGRCRAPSATPRRPRGCARGGRRSPTRRPAGCGRPWWRRSRRRSGPAAPWRSAARCGRPRRRPCSRRRRCRSGSRRRRARRGSCGSTAPPAGGPTSAIGMAPSPIGKTSVPASRRVFVSIVVMSTTFPAR